MNGTSLRHTKLKENFQVDEKEKPAEDPEKAGDDKQGSGADYRIGNNVAEMIVNFLVRMASLNVEGDAVQERPSAAANARAMAREEVKF